MPATVAIGSDSKLVVTGGCDWELRDSTNKTIPNSPGGASGGEPAAEWVLLPCDSTVRLRASAYNGGRLKASVFTIDLPYHHFWQIPAHGTNQYFLSGTFIVNPPPNHVPRSNHVVWSGKLTLPKVRIPLDRL